MKTRIIVMIAVALAAASCRSRKPAAVTVQKAEPTTVATQCDDPAARVIAEARRWLGVPYRYGGNDRDGLDCSGLTTIAYRDGAGIELPRNSSAQAAYATPVERKDLRPGDLVFFSSSQGGDRINHVAIYLSGDSIIHATTSRGVVITPLSAPYWDKHYMCAGTVFKKQ